MIAEFLRIDLTSLEWISWAKTYWTLLISLMAHIQTCIHAYSQIITIMRLYHSLLFCINFICLVYLITLIIKCTIYFSLSSHWLLFCFYDKLSPYNNNNNKIGLITTKGILEEFCLRHYNPWKKVLSISSECR